MKIYCCGCEDKVEARLTGGFEVYPKAIRLHDLPFWKCDECDNFVGCHHKTSNPTAPLGCIPTPQVREARKTIHRKLDPVWKGGIASRNQIYKMLSRKLDRKYHTAGIRSTEEAEDVCNILDEVYY